MAIPQPVQGTVYHCALICIPAHFVQAPIQRSLSADPVPTLYRPPASSVVSSAYSEEFEADAAQQVWTVGHRCESGGSGVDQVEVLHELIGGHRYGWGDNVDQGVISQ